MSAVVSRVGVWSRMWRSLRSSLRAPLWSRLWSRLRSRLRWELRRSDGALLLGLVVVVLLDDATSVPVSVGLLVVVAVGLAASRTTPAVSLALASSLGAGVYVEGLGAAGPLSGAVALSFLAGRRMARIRQAQYAFAAVTLAGLAVTALLGELNLWVSLVMFQFATALLPWWVGSWWRQRGELSRAEAERIEQARLRERARIARDMHDSLGHELSLMALVAGGLELAPGLAAEHQATAARLRAGAVSATERLHEIIGLLGTPSEPGGERSEEATSDADIPGLVERARRSGMRVTLEQSGAPVPEGAGEHAARRVVQESLTNAVKHAPGAEVAVRVVREAQETLVSVANGPSPGGRALGGGSGTGSGTGLISLDERVRLAGGSLRAEAREADGGFEVTARLPRVPAEAAPVGRPPKEREQRALLRLSALPLLVAGSLLAFLIGSYVYTVHTTALEHGAFDGLRIGAPRDEVAEVLPSHAVDEPPPVLAEPPAPDGAECAYYRAGTHLLDLSGTMYRLCFADGVLVAKDVLRAVEGS
ncbi:histidine kinase [Streptomyces sp. B6B3]|uniref:sensor histidine kinase n=1 Tax=Streptomyces sp. B6B3 TaxID=3153570 RepID=UPI00325DB275